MEQSDSEEVEVALLDHSGDLPRKRHHRKWPSWTYRMWQWIDSTCDVCLMPQVILVLVILSVFLVVWWTNILPIFVSERQSVPVAPSPTDRPHTLLVPKRLENRSLEEVPPKVVDPMPDEDFFKDNKVDKKQGVS